MRGVIRAFVSLLLAWFAALPALAAESAVMDTGRVEARLVSSHDAVRPGQTFHVALLTELDPGWHTYWRNPGDSGEPVQIGWEVMGGVGGGVVVGEVEVGEIAWPVPEPIPTGPIVNYGFEGAPLFPVEMRLPADAPALGGTVAIAAEAYYLVCKDICIPESARLELEIAVKADAEVDPRWDSPIREALEAAPPRSERAAGARLEGNELIVDIGSGTGAGGRLGAPYLFPYENWVIDHSAPQSVRDGAWGMRFRLAPGYGWDDTPESFEALLAYDGPGDRSGGRVGEIVTVAVGAAVDVGELAPPAEGAAESGGEPGGEGGSVLIPAILGALLGGLILNLMPCVFPIISLKALSLARTVHSERAQARAEAWLYTAGVLATMLLLAGIITAFKAGGASLGWGFQLQDPRVVGLLALVTFAIGLNLIGAYQIGGGLQNLGGGLASGGGRSPAFFTGVLAVIVATPCTAPFMAGAIGVALTQSAGVTLAVFAALGLGLALPFLLLAYVPGLSHVLPKPGAWMETFRQALAFPMFATAIWLAWVLGNQAGTDGVAVLLLSALLIGFAAWLFNRERARASVRLLAGAVVVAGIGLPLTLRLAPSAMAEASDALVWSPEAVEAELAEGRAVFVDFTADWCVTCKVNERVVLSRPDVRALFTETDTAFMVADWTNKNDAIAQELARFERAGVPLYLVYPRGGHDGVRPAILPQILTRDVVSEALINANR